MPRRPQPRDAARDHPGKHAGQQHRNGHRRDGSVQPARREVVKDRRQREEIQPDNGAGPKQNVSVAAGRTQHTGTEARLGPKFLCSFARVMARSEKQTIPVPGPTVCR